MNNPPAFPTGTGVTPYNPGMTLLDYFAAKAMQGMMVDVDQPKCDYIAQTAYKMADTMLRVREKGWEAKE